MKTQKVQTLYVRWKGKKLKIPGGWELRIPEILELDPFTTNAYSRYFQRAKGYDKFEAEKKVREVFSDLLASNWYRMQTLSIRRWAKQYAKSYPELVRADGTLEGFKPEEFQNLYVPGANTGRAGKVSAKKLFREMAGEEVE